MRTLLVSALSALALGVMTSAALAEEPAEPTAVRTGLVTLTDAQMDQVVAGQVGVCLLACINLGIAANVLSTDSTAETGPQTINIGSSD